MSNNQNSSIVEVEAVTKIYHQGKVDVHALRGLSLTVQKGEFTAICGPSGSGKTTMLNLIGALDTPTSGSVVLEGKDLAKLNRKELSEIRRDRIGFVFQAYNLMPVLTAYENAELVMWVQGVDIEERRKRVMSLLAEVGLEGMENAANPAVVLADEPTANVDSDTADKLLGIMEKLNQDHGVTFIFSTHDPKVMNRARRLIRLVDGQVDNDEVRN
jgi:putative ABC transport system ATP-binding protein